MQKHKSGTLCLLCPHLTAVWWCDWDWLLLLEDCIRLQLNWKENISLIVAVQLKSRRFCCHGILFTLQRQANHRLLWCTHSRHIKRNGVLGKFRSTWMHHSFLCFSISHTTLLLAQRFCEFAVHPLAVPISLPSCPHFSSLMAECVCIDTAPQSYTAVWGQYSPAGGELNDKVNECGWNSGMPP